ncbi:carboxylate--amine ligase, partial [Aliarcobacter lanthieri]
LLKIAGLPAPIHSETNSKDEALHIARTLNYPVVVKSLDLDRGEGVSVNIFDEKSLIKAFEVAYSLSKRKQVIIERQVKG